MPVVTVDTGSHGPQTLYGIQHLRFVAAMMVVVAHATMRIEKLYPDWIVSEWPLGASGVDIFFVVSGFIMVLITKDGPPKPLNFWLGRVFRIVPLYWLVTLLAVLFRVLAPEYFAARATGGDILQSLFFFRVRENLPIIRPGWTLNLEMAFYLMLSISLLARRAYIFVVLLFLFVFYSAATILSRTAPVFAFYTIHGFILEFGLGILLALVLQRDHGIKPVWGFPIMILGFVLLFLMWRRAGEIGRFFACGIPAFLIVGGAVLVEPYCRSSLSKRLSIFGDASYAIYLTHTVFVLVPAFRLASRNQAWLQANVPPAVLSALFILVPIVVGLVTHLYFERPIARFIKRLRSRTPRTQVVAAPVPAG